MNIKTARDAASTLLGLGFLSLAFSLGYLVLSSMEGFGPLGWLGWGVGPITLILALIMVPAGQRSSRKARRLRPE